MKSIDSRINTIKVPVYNSMVERIRQLITAGQVQPGGFLNTEYDLAETEGISRNSVRRGVDLLISEGLVERRPSKGIFVREKHVASLFVQVLVPDICFDQCAQIVRGAQTAGRSRGVVTQIYDAHGSAEQTIEFIRRLPESSCDGAIITSLHFANFAESIYELKRQRYPFVLVDDRLRDIDVPSVVADNYGGGYAVGQRLIELGHTQIGFIGYLNAQTVYQRLEGLRDAMANAGLLLEPSHIVDLQLDNLLCKDFSDKVEQATCNLMSLSNRPSALFYHDDGAAKYGYRTLSRMGLSIPDDVSVVGFDDNPLCQWLTPQLSTVKQPSIEMGHAAMEMLLQQIAHPAGKSEHQVIKTKWIERGSSAMLERNFAKQKILCIR